MRTIVGTLDAGPPEGSGGGESLAAARRRSVFLAAGFSGHQGHELAGAAKEAIPPWPERLETAHLRAVFARESPVQRQGGLVGPAAIAAVPAPESRLHNAPGRPASDFNLVATRLRCRPSASPQSPAPEAVVVALPMDSRWLVVQWRRVRPSRMDAPRPAASIARPDVSEFHCRCLISMRDTRFLPRPAAGTRLWSGVGPSEGVGNPAYTRPWPEPRGAAAPEAIAAETSTESRLRSRFASLHRWERSTPAETTIGRSRAAIGPRCRSRARPQRRLARNPGSATRSGEPS